LGARLVLRHRGAELRGHRVLVNHRKFGDGTYVPLNCGWPSIVGAYAPEGTR
jgi:hypothetical protein